MNYAAAILGILLLRTSTKTGPRTQLPDVPILPYPPSLFLRPSHHRIMPYVLSALQIGLKCHPHALDDLCYLCLLRMLSRQQQRKEPDDWMAESTVLPFISILVICHSYRRKASYVLRPTAVLLKGSCCVPRDTKL